MICRTRRRGHCTAGAGNCQGIFAPWRWIKNAPRSGFFIGSGVRSPGTPAPGHISLSLLLVRRRKQLARFYHGRPSAASAIYAHLCNGRRINGPVGGVKKAPHDAELSVQSAELLANLGDD